MNRERATEVLMTSRRLSSKVRKYCMKQRETAMRSETPIYKEVDTDEFGKKHTEYFSSKPLEQTVEQRYALRLRRATREQLLRWTRRNLVREAACSGIAERIDTKAATSELRRKQKFEALAQRHDAIVTACLKEIYLRDEKAKSRGN